MSKLPPLPRQNKSAEAEFGILFRKWIGRNPQPTGAYELKHTRGSGVLAWSAVEGPQVAHGRKIMGEGILIRVMGTKGEPDYVWMRGEPAWVVIRYPRFWCIIGMEAFVRERDGGGAKSLSDSQARLIASTVIEI